MKAKKKCSAATMLTFIRLLAFPLSNQWSIAVPGATEGTYGSEDGPLVVVPDGAKEDFGSIVKP